MDAIERERRWLQAALGLGGLVPVAAGLYGAIFAAGLTGDTLGVSGASHYRYLSGLLLGIGLVAWSAIPGVERAGGRLRVLTVVVVCGGLARLFGLRAGVPSGAMMAALAMELLVVPAICLWQGRVARLHRDPPRTDPSP